MHKCCVSWPNAAVSCTGAPNWRFPTLWASGANWRLLPLGGFLGWWVTYDTTYISIYIVPYLTHRTGVVLWFSIRIRVVIELPLRLCGSSKIQLPQLICPQSSMKGARQQKRRKMWQYNAVWFPFGFMWLGLFGFGLPNTIGRWVDPVPCRCRYNLHGNGSSGTGSWNRI